MYSKLAAKNVKKSFKDYAIYFLTLTFAVCIFYSFNSIESQKAVLEMNGGMEEYLDTMAMIINVLSFFVSAILGGLIIYANNFLIKRRKKELGVYMTLGMSKKKISNLLVRESLIIGAISLGAGLLIGIVLSQGLSVFTAKLFEVNMSEYKFIFSIGATIKTILYFGIMFVLMMIFNTFIISKYKLIDLLNASKKSEDIKVKSPILATVFFALGVVALGAAYGLVIKVGLDILDARFYASLILGIVGTGFFFYGLAGFILCFISRSKNIYFKKLNIFVTRQISSKINTNFMSISVICLMLFVTIGILSTGLSCKNAVEQGVEATTPFDASANIMDMDFYNKGFTVEQVFEKANVDINEITDHVQFNRYILEGSLEELLLPYISDSNNKFLGSYNRIEALTITDYNNIRKLQDKEPLELGKDEVIVTSNFNNIVPVIKAFMKDNETIKLGGIDYTIKNKDIIKDAYKSTGNPDNYFTLIVPDDSLNSVEGYETSVNFRYKEGHEKDGEEVLNKVFKESLEGRDGSEDYLIFGFTKGYLYESTKGMSTAVLYVGIYLGIVFLLASTAVLALQQLSEASDSIDRYKALRKIGATQKMINKTIFIQTLIYFITPLALALVHAVVGIKVANEFVALYGSPDIGASALMTAALMIIVYGGYFYATYAGYKNIIG